MPLVFLMERRRNTKGCISPKHSAFPQAFHSSIMKSWWMHVGRFEEDIYNSFCCTSKKARRSHKNEDQERERNKLGDLGSDALQELEMLTVNAKETQELILTKILERNQASEYLSKFMNGSTDNSAFMENVPVVTYDVVKPYIARIATGEESSILCGERIVELLRSSGTSRGEPRLMPAISEDLDRRTYLYGLLMPIMNKYISGLGEGKAMYLLFVKAETLTNSGIPVRSVLTSYYKSPHFLHRKHDQYNNYTSPDEVILCPDSQQSMYCQLLCGLVERQHVLRLGAVFASAFLRSISFLEQHWSDLVNDIRFGNLNSSVITNPACRLAMVSFLTSPNPELADVVEAICSCPSWKGILGRLWPNVKYVEAVLTGTMAQYIPMLEFYTGGRIPLVCTMYASSESYFGVNLRPLCNPTDVSYTILPNMAYFEFIPLEDGLRVTDDDDVVENDKLVSLVDVKVGCYYELVVTTFSGLYRYRVGDVLQVTGFYNCAPQFKFICRRNVILSIDSDKTNEEDLHNSVTRAQKILEKRNYILLEYTSYTDTSTVPGHYVLFWEIKSTCKDATTPLDPQLLESCCIAVEESLDYIYRRCRAHDKSVGPLEIRLVEAGAFDALMDLLVSQGSSINQYKTPRCIECGLALKLLNSKVIACFFSPRDPEWSM